MYVYVYICMYIYIYIYISMACEDPDPQSRLPEFDVGARDLRRESRIPRVCISYLHFGAHPHSSKLQCLDPFLQIQLLKTGPYSGPHLADQTQRQLIIFTFGQLERSTSQRCTSSQTTALHSPSPLPDAHTSTLTRALIHTSVLRFRG